MRSHPSWVCGLKLEIGEGDFALHLVTPFVGVWIETACLYMLSFTIKSHPSWVCGLKLNISPYLASFARHTLRGCVD